MSTLTSSLIVRLIDQVTGPARQIGNSLLGLSQGPGSFGGRLNAAIAANNAGLDRSRARLFDAAAGFYVLRNALGAPMSNAAAFETALEDIGQKANIPRDRLSALGDEIEEIARATNQSTMQIASAVDALVGRGAAEDVALAAADPIGRAATAYRASTDDLAAASWSAVDNLRVPAGEIGTALDMMAAAGKEGAFELADMARYFPSLGAAYQGLGESGTDAVADLAAALQVVRAGTGDASSAATNLHNVLQKIYAPQTIRAFEDFGIDLREAMADAAEQGMSPIEAIASITNEALDGDLSRLGELFGDAQVQAGLRSLIQGFSEYQRIRDEAMSASGVVDEDFARRLETAQGVMDRWNATIERLNISIGSTLVPLLNTMLDRIIPIVDTIGQWATANPKLAQTIVAATAGVIGFKVAVAGLSFVGLLGRGGALAMLSLGFNTIGKAAIGAAKGARGMAAYQTALAGMAGTKLTGLGKLTAGLRGMALAVPGIGPLAGTLTAVGGALAGVSAPVWGGIAVAVGLVAAAGALLWKYWDRVTSVLGGVASRIGEELQPAFEAIRPVLDTISPVVDAIGSSFSAAGEALGGFVGWLGSFFEREVLTEEEKAAWGNAGYDMADRMIESIKAKIMEIVDWFRGLPGMVLDAVGSIDLGSVIKIPNLDPRSWFGGAEVEAPTQGHGGNTLYPVGEAPAIDNPSGHRAGGGPVWPGSSFLVGEHEPEVFTPTSSGEITPLSAIEQKVDRALAAKTQGGPVRPNVNVTIGDIVVDGNASPIETARRVRDTIVKEIEQALRGTHADMAVR